MLLHEQRQATPVNSRSVIEATAEASKLVKKRDVARAVSVSPRCVENWMARKRIPFIRLSPRCVRFDLQRVLAALGEFEVREVSREK